MAMRVRLLSGEVVWEGERPATLAALRAAAVRTRPRLGGCAGEHQLALRVRASHA